MNLGKTTRSKDKKKSSSFSSREAAAIMSTITVSRGQCAAILRGSQTVIVRVLAHDSTECNVSFPPAAFQAAYYIDSIQSV